MELPYCTRCGTELKEGAKFCHICGQAVTRKTRPKVPAIPEAEVGYRIDTIDYSKEDKPLEVILLMMKGVTHDGVILSGKGEIHVSTLELVGSPTTRMRFRIDDGDIVPMRLTPTGGIASLDTTKLSNGEHTLTVLAVDSRNNRAEKSVKVIIKNKLRLVKRVVGLAYLLPGLFLIWAGGIFGDLVVAYMSGSSPNIIYLVICGLPLIFGLPLAFFERTRGWAEFLIGFWVVGIIFFILKSIF